MIVGASATTVDGFSIPAHHGPAFLIQNATKVRIRNVSIENGYVWKAGLIDVSGSDVDIEGLSVISQSTAYRW